MLVFAYRLFGTVYRSHQKGSSSLERKPLLKYAW
jgi:hypothetical protein